MRQTQNRHNRSWDRLVRHYANTGAEPTKKFDFDHSETLDYWKKKFTEYTSPEMSLFSDAAPLFSLVRVHELLADSANGNYNREKTQARESKAIQTYKAAIAYLSTSQAISIYSKERVLNANNFNKLISHQNKPDHTPHHTITSKEHEHLHLLGDLLFGSTLMTHFPSRAKSYNRLLAQTLSTWPHETLTNLIESIIQSDQTQLPDISREKLDKLLMSCFLSQQFVDKLFSPPNDANSHQQLRSGNIIVNPLAKLITDALYRTALYRTGHMDPGEDPEKSIIKIRNNVFFKHLPLLMRAIQNTPWTAHQKKNLQISALIKKSDSVEQVSVLAHVLQYYMRKEVSTSMLGVHYEVIQTLMHHGFDLLREEKKALNDPESQLAVAIPSGSLQMYLSRLEADELQRAIQHQIHDAVPETQVKHSANRI